MKFILIIALMSLSFLSLPSQDLSLKKSILIDRSGDAEIFLDAESLEESGDQILVWVTNRFAKPREVKFLDTKVKAKSIYYMMNLELARYSIIAVKYYDVDNKETHSFSYVRKSKIPEYNFNFPVYKNSIEEKIADRIKKLTSK